MKNLKKVVAILLVIMALAGTLVIFNSCGSEPSEATIELYMPYVVSLDPAVAYTDDASAKLISLLYEGLTNISADGTLTKGVASSWKKYTDRDDNKVIEFKLKNTQWSDGTTVSSENFLDAWERILNPEFNCQAAPLLFPIKNAQAVKRGELTVSDLGISADKQDTLKITLEDWADYDTFLRNCASIALSPIRKDIINKIYDRKQQKENDWSALVAIIANNGPFFVKSVSFGNASDNKDTDRPYMIFERNVNYLRDVEDGGDDIDEYVLPFRIHVNMTYGNDDFWPEVEKNVVSSTGKIDNLVKTQKASMTAEELEAAGGEAGLRATITAQIRKEEALKLSDSYLDTLLAKINVNKDLFYDEYNEGDILYNNALPFDEEPSQAVTTKNSMITGSFLFNIENPLFADAKVRQALSMVLDREKIASMVKYAEAANTLVTDGVFETGVKTSFKDKADYGISTTATAQDVADAKQLLAQAGVTGGSFTISVRACDVDILIASYAQDVWNELGFDVKVIVYGYDVVTYTVRKLQSVKDKNGNITKEWIDEPIYDTLLHDTFMDVYNNATFDVIFFDIHMLTTDAFPVLAQFATLYSGRAYNFSDAASFDVVLPHVTGYVSDQYDELLIKAMTETDKAKRAELLHAAEKILLADLPMTPVIYYQNAYLKSKDLTGIKADYFGVTHYDKAVYENYVAPVETEGEEVADTTAAE
ncbi:MAG: hypothetical protein IKM34_02160 [Clostridia bacterium]|nr:hypothetical protein [Clostridia bacterium]